MNQSQTVLITGASGGIGAALARLFARDGYRLILVARGQAGLDALAKDLTARHQSRVKTIAADLSEPGGPARIWEEATAGGGAVDILVNNAGVGLYGPLAELDAGPLERMLALNVAALAMLTRLALPGMLERGSGRILNVGSLVGHQPGGPRMVAYFASKAFVLSFSRGLSAELSGTGVSVTALSPPALRTGFDARMDSGAGATYRNTLLYRYLSGSNTDAIARAGYRGLLRGKRIVIPGFFNRLLAWGGELPPRSLALAVNRILLAPRPGVTSFRNARGPQPGG